MFEICDEKALSLDIFVVSLPSFRETVDSPWGWVGPMIRSYYLVCLTCSHGSNHFFWKSDVSPPLLIFEAPFHENASHDWLKTSSTKTRAVPVFSRQDRYQELVKEAQDRNVGHLESVTDMTNLTEFTVTIRNYKNHSWTYHIRFQAWKMGVLVMHAFSPNTRPAIAIFAQHVQRSPGHLCRLMFEISSPSASPASPAMKPNNMIWHPRLWTWLISC